MLSNPRENQIVQAWYAVPKRPIARFHGLTGVIVTPGHGTPRNHLVRFGGELAIIPGGQLRIEPTTMENAS